MYTNVYMYVYMYMIYSAFLGNRFNVCAECTGSFFISSPPLGIADRKAAAVLFTHGKNHKHNYVGTYRSAGGKGKITTMTETVFKISEPQFAQSTILGKYAYRVISFNVRLREFRRSTFRIFFFLLS